MESKIVGVGCFGKAEKLACFFKKTLAENVWGGLQSGFSAGIFDGPAENCGRFCSSGRMDASQTRVAGFFLTLRENNMQLYIFTRSRGGKLGCHAYDMARLRRCRPEASLH